MAGEDPLYLAWVRLQSCLMAETDGERCWGPIEADHVGERAYGKRAHDREAVPLCRGHHKARTDITGVFGRMARIQRKEWCAEAIDRTQALYHRTHPTPCGDIVSVINGTYRCREPRGHTGPHRAGKAGDGWVEWPQARAGEEVIGKLVHHDGRVPSSSLREALADYAHGAWSESLRGFLNAEDPHHAAEKNGWLRRAMTNYSELSEEEKAIARREADRIIAIATKCKGARS